MVIERRGRSPLGSFQRTPLRNFGRGGVALPPWICTVVDSVYLPLPNDLFGLPSSVRGDEETLQYDPVLEFSESFGTDPEWPWTHYTWTTFEYIPGSVDYQTNDPVQDNEAQFHQGETSGRQFSPTILTNDVRVVDINPQGTGGGSKVVRWSNVVAPNPGRPTDEPWPRESFFIGVDYSPFPPLETCQAFFIEQSAEEDRRWTIGENVKLGF